MRCGSTLRASALRARGLGLAVAATAGLTLVFTAPARAQEYRAFWVDAWHAGFLNQTQVNDLLGVVGSATSKGQIRNANCNAVFVQVRRRADVCFPSGMGEPYFSSGLSPSNFNALQAMINAAHDTTGGKKRIEVHCWIVTFATGSGGTGGVVYSRHNNPADPANYWVTLDNSGVETDDKAFDPGHPNCLQYTVNVAMDIVNNFDVDGIHYDYIRFTANNQGYNPTSIARYNARYGLSGQPVASNEQFKQWRRDQVSAVVRQVYARIQSSKPWVKQSGSFVTWNPSPTSSTRSAFMNTRPYYDVYSDWDSWMQEGIVDMAVPMTYYNYASLPSDWTRWMNFEKDRKGNRHMIVGPGIYLNSLSNSILELQQTRNASPAGNYAQGFCGYSYYEPYDGGTWAGFSPSLIAQVTPSWVDIPSMPWKTNPTTGHISGTVTQLPDGAWADHAMVSITGPVNRSMYVDGTGFYAFIDAPVGNYTITASKAGYPNATATANVAIGEVTGNMYVRDMQLGIAAAPQISNLQVAGITGNSATITWTTSSFATSQVRYGTTSSYGLLTSLDTNEVATHNVQLVGLSSDTPYHFQAVSTNGYGSDQSDDQTFTTTAFVDTIIIDNTDPGWANTSPSGGWTSASSSAVPKIGTDYLYASGSGSTSTVTRRCTWTPNLPRAGLWDVYVYYQLGTNRNNAAPYTVFYNGGNLTSVQNQYSPISNQGGWFLIGQDLPFLAGTSGYVQLANNCASTAYVSADAAKFVYKSSGDNTPPTTPVVTDDGQYAWTVNRLHASWTTTDPETGIQECEYRIIEQGGAVVRDWTSVGPVMEVTATDLSLALGKNYVIEVVATNTDGLLSEAGSSNGIAIFGLDADGNGHVDNADNQSCQACMAGPGVPYPTGGAVDCERFDTDGDGDVDNVDYGIFQRCLTAGDPINLACAGN
jgi:uncharacterized lipoprotein YddW (UPF0748 family)